MRDNYINCHEIDPETILSMPSKTNKTYGYDDSFEHSFNYIDNDIQDDHHVVLPFPRGGTSARLDNKKQHARDIF
jgi:hypothetical protein